MANILATSKFTDWSAFPGGSGAPFLTLDDGRWATVVSAEGAGGTYSAVQFFDSYGEPVGDPIRIVTDKSVGGFMPLANGRWLMCSNPPMIFDGNGELVGSGIDSEWNATIPLDTGGWVSFWYEQLPHSGKRDVHVQGYRADGEPLGTPTRIAASVGEYWSWRLIEVDSLAGGGWVVCWVSANRVKGQDIFQRAFDAAGEPLGRKILIDTIGKHDDPDVDIVALADGGWVVSRTAGDGSGQGIVRQVFDANGEPAGGEGLVNSTTKGVQHNAHTIEFEDGGWVVVWNSGRQNRICQQLYSADGQPIGGETRVNVGARSDSGFNAVALEGGGWLVVWGKSGTDRGVYQQAYSADGEAMGGVTLVVDEASRGHATALADGGWVITWVGDGRYSYPVYQCAFLPDGSPAGESMYIGWWLMDSHWTVTALGDGGWMTYFDFGNFQFFHINHDPSGMGVTLAGGDGHSPFLLTAAMLLSAHVDSDGDTIALSGLVASDGATIADRGDGSWLVTPSGGFRGIVTLSFTISDGMGGSTATTQRVAFGMSVFAGGSNSDTLVGDGGDNVIDGGSADDTLTGGAGADLFIFGLGYGRDIITDLALDGSESDVIDLSGTGIRDYLDLVSRYLSESDGDVVITLSDGSQLVLADRTLADLSSVAFQF